MNLTKVIAPIAFVFAAMIGCNQNSSNQNSGGSQSDIASSTDSNLAVQVNPASLPSELLGAYEGEQPSYTLKNSSGEDLVISGKKVKAPNSKYKILLETSNKVSMVQTNLEDKSTYAYVGTYNITKEQDGIFEITCNLSDQKSSTPTYRLILDSKSFTMKGSGNNEPEFTLKNTKAESSGSKQIEFEGVLGTEYLGQGEWSVELKVTQGKLKGKTITVWKTTCGLGMVDENSIEIKGDLELDGSDYHYGQRVKGVLVETKGKFANLDVGGPIIRDVWRFKELYRN